MNHRVPMHRPTSPTNPTTAPAASQGWRLKVGLLVGLRRGVRRDLTGGPPALGFPSPCRSGWAGWSGARRDSRPAAPTPPPPA